METVSIITNGNRGDDSKRMSQQYLHTYMPRDRGRWGQLGEIERSQPPNGNACRFNRAAFLLTHVQDIDVGNLGSTETVKAVKRGAPRDLSRRCGLEVEIRQIFLHHVSGVDNATLSHIRQRKP